MHSLRRLAPLFLLVQPACKDEEHTHTEPHSHEHAVTLQFAARVGDAPAACGEPLALGVDGAPGTLADARLYVSGISMRDASGAWVPVTLDDDGMWQSGGVALLDFEDGTGACADSGTSATRDVITGVVPHGDYAGLRFDLGVPFALNHVNAAEAPAPLNAPGMFWVWQGGFKFARVDFAIDGDSPSRWNVHLGSTGCVSDAPTIAPEQPCAKPNLATITIDGFDHGADRIDLDLGALVAGVEVTANTPDTPPGCMSAPTEPDDCGPTFASVGLDFATGACAADCVGQELFAGTPR